MKTLKVEVIAKARAGNSSMAMLSDEANTAVVAAVVEVTPGGPNKVATQAGLRCAAMETAVAVGHRQYHHLRNHLSQG